MRAAVFTAVDEEERKQGVRMDNPRLQQLVRSPEGPYLVGLLEDFLSYYGMAFTRSTLESEASMVSGVSVPPRGAATLVTQRSAGGAHGPGMRGCRPAAQAA